MCSNSVFFFPFSPSPEWTQQWSDPQWDLLHPRLPEGQALCAGGSSLLQILWPEGNSLQAVREGTGIPHSLHFTLGNWSCGMWVTTRGISLVMDFLHTLPSYTWFYTEMWIMYIIPSCPQIIPSCWWVSGWEEVFHDSPHPFLIQCIFGARWEPGLGRAFQVWSDPVKQSSVSISQLFLTLHSGFSTLTEHWAAVPTDLSILTPRF